MQIKRLAIIPHPLPRSLFFFPFPFLLMGKKNTSSDRWLHISHYTYQRNCRPTCLHILRSEWDEGVHMSVVGLTDFITLSGVS